MGAFTVPRDQSCPVLRYASYELVLLVWGSKRLVRLGSGSSRLWSYEALICPHHTPYDDVENNEPAGCCFVQELWAC